MFSEIFGRLSLLAQTPNLPQTVPDTIAARQPYYSWMSSPLWLTVIGLSFVLTIVFFYGLIKRHRAGFQ